MTESLEQEIQTLRSLFWSERDPDGRGFVPLADAYRRAGDVRQAMDLLSDGLARHPEFAPAHVVAARLYVEQGMVEEGEMAARKALDLDAENVLALGALLRVLEQRGNGEEARKVRDRLLALDPDSLGGEDAPAKEASVGEATMGESVDAGMDAAGAGLIDISGMSDFSLAGDEASQEAAAHEEEASPDDAAPGFELEGITLDTTSLGADSGPDPADSEAVDVSALAPDAEPETDAPEFTLMAADEAPDAPDEVDVSALAPDLEAAAADPMDIGALAPEDDEAAADLVDISALAPDDDAAADLVDISALAPDDDAASSDVVDISALAPDATDVVDVSALAPDDDAASSDVVDISALAPDADDVVDISALAPDDDAAAADVVDISALAPDDDGAATDVVDISALAPDEPDVVDIASLAPEPAADALDVAMLVPDEEPVVGAASGQGASYGGSDDSEDPEEEVGRGGAPIYTRTLAELYVKQGFTDRAIEVLRYLQRNAPDEESLARRIEELEAGQVAAEGGPPRVQVPRRLPGGPEAAALVREADEEVEASARDLAESGDEGHDVDTPFAWTEHEEDAAEEPQPSIREYFEGLLTWRSRGS